MLLWINVAFLGDAGVSGWGYTKVLGTQDSVDLEAVQDAERENKRVLHRTTVQVMEKEACRQFYANDYGSRGFANHSGVLCAGYKPGGKDACLGTRTEVPRQLVPVIFIPSHLIPVIWSRVIFGPHTI